MRGTTESSLHFNPCIHFGCEHSIATKPMFQYTHPSGCDSLFSFLKMLMYVSIRAFHWNAIPLIPAATRRLLLQPAHPLQDATEVPQFGDRHTRSFNTRIPRGMRFVRYGLVPTLWASTHTSLVGCDWKISASHTLVSIHAPLWDAISKPDNHENICMLQPAHPPGCDIHLGYNYSITTVSIHATLVGCDCVFIEPEKPIFISRQRIVSTHTPLTGCD